MKASTRNIVYIVTAIVGFATLVATIYAGVLDPSKLVEATKEAGTVASSILAVLSGILAKVNLTPDPEA